MIFNQLSFFLFFAAFLLLGSLTSGARNKKILILTFSVFFYGYWNWKFLPAIIFTTFIDYTAGRLLAKHESQRMRLLVLSISLLSNILFLGFFKYTNFILSNFTSSNIVLDVIIPLGLSFHTFQGMSYTIDVYRKKTAPVKSILDFSIYILYFPQLVAGPIVRAQEFFRNLNADLNSKSNIRISDHQLFLRGFIKKALIADHLANIIAPYYLNPGGYSHAVGWLVTFAYYLQIYCDFSGYIDMARGCAGAVGIPLPINFNRPYLSKNPREFWQKWNISISNWFRDYVYIPLGGNRHGHLRTTFNILFTFTLSGLWHGANWTMVLFGFVHGMGVIVQNIFSRIFKTKINFCCEKYVSIFLNTIWISLAFVLFRATDLSNATEIYARLFMILPGGNQTINLDYRNALVFSILVLGIWSFNEHAAKSLHQRYPLVSKFVFGSVWALALAMTTGELKPFIYYQF